MLPCVCYTSLVIVVLVLRNSFAKLCSCPLPFFIKPSDQLRQVAALPLFITAGEVATSLFPERRSPANGRTGPRRGGEWRNRALQSPSGQEESTQSSVSPSSSAIYRLPGLAGRFELGTLGGVSRRPEWKQAHMPQAEQVAPGVVACVDLTPAGTFLCVSLCC